VHASQIVLSCSGSLCGNLDPNKTCGCLWKAEVGTWSVECFVVLATTNNNADYASTPFNTGIRFRHKRFLSHFLTEKTLQRTPEFASKHSEEIVEAILNGLKCYNENGGFTIFG
jgi:hypothetical protein